MFKTTILAHLFVLAILWGGHFSLTGCTHRMAFGGCDYRVKTGECRQPPTTLDTNIIVSSYAAVDNLVRHPTQPFPTNARWLVTSIANLDNLDRSTSLGRLIGEQLSARLVQQGRKVIETKMHPGLIMIPHTGEFILTRDWQALGQTYHADMIITGTYATAKDKIYITLKMLNCKSGEIMSSYAYTLPVGPNTQALLQKSFWWW